jgi:hypothetical protein
MELQESFLNTYMVNVLNRLKEIKLPVGDRVLLVFVVMLPCCLILPFLSQETFEWFRWAVLAAIAFAIFGRS